MLDRLGAKLWCLAQSILCACEKKQKLDRISKPLEIPAHVFPKNVH
jgi:hypothetical protein